MESAAEDDIRRVLEAEWRAFFERDFDGFARHWVHAPYVRRTLSGPFTGTRTFIGWNTIAARIQEGMKRFSQAYDPATCLKWDNLIVRTGTDMAWVTYDQVRTSDDVELQASCFQHETKILELEDGAWKLVSLTIIVPDIGREDVPQVELDAEGRVVHVNALGRSRLADHPGLVLSGRRLRARSMTHDAALQAGIEEMIRRLSATNDPKVFLANRVEHVPLGEDDFSHPLYCWIGVEQERIIVSFDDTVMMRQRLELASGVFALSPAQTRLAEALVEGHDLPTAAADLGVSVNTVRTQLRRMFEKTGTNSQSGMISMLLGVERPK